MSAQPTNDTPATQQRPQMSVHDRRANQEGLKDPTEFPLCPDCEGPLKLLNDDSRYAYCVAADCAVDGLPAGEVALDHQQSDRGLPRPVLEGRPVPWLAPIIGDRVAWTALNAARGCEAERSWLCQVCGDSLDVAPTAWVAISAGEVAAGGAMHRRCMDLARKVCPVLRSDASIVFVEVRRDDQKREWAAVIERLVAYEDQQGQLPDLVVYPTWGTSNNPGDHDG